MTQAPRVALSDVLSSLSYALDLTEGQLPGHTVRTCLIGMRIAEEIGLGAEERSALYYALLLKDAGCSSNAARMCALFGTDDRAVKPGMKLVDWDARGRLAMATWRLAGVGQSLVERTRRMLRIARTQELTRALIQLRCDRGAAIVRQLGFPTATSEAVHSLDEHWNGRGYPEGLRGEAIPLLARIANLAQVTDVFHGARGVEETLAEVRTRAGRWFDPRLARVVTGWRRDRDWWGRVKTATLETIAPHEPPDHLRSVDEEGLDTIATAFADIIDAKSPYTFNHSRSVASYARAAAGRLGMSPEATRRIYRAALLHDIGKLGISNTILDKPGPLDAEERREIERHPLFTFEILSRVPAFADFARTAALHHERLDGSGYPWGVTGDALDVPARILCVADFYDAISADRPYRPRMSTDRVAALLSQERERRLCGDIIDALWDARTQDETWTPAAIT